MCNLYRMTRTVNEIARLFDASGELQSNAGGEVYPGYTGLVVADGTVQSMTWGFPLTLKGKSGQPLKPKPVNNARTDKLDSFFWRSSFQERRCLIPVDAYAEAEGPKGSKTRTWFAMPDGETFACAGVWRESDEWGRVYSMVMTEASSAVAGIHDRMPVILKTQDHHRWTNGQPDEAMALCTPWDDKLTIERSGTPWVRKT